MEHVDKLAKTAAISDNYQTLSWTSYEALHLVDSWIWDRWCTQWKSKSNSTYQNTFKFHRGFNHKFCTRKAEITITRFRMLQTRLNHGLYKINKHPSGLCDHCGVSQDCKHFIFKCKITEGLRKVLIQWVHRELREGKYEEVLSNGHVLNSLYEFCSKNEVII